MRSTGAQQIYMGPETVSEIPSFLKTLDLHMALSATGKGLLVGLQRFNHLTYALLGCSQTGRGAGTVSHWHSQTHQALSLSLGWWMAVKAPLELLCLLREL